MSRLAAFLASGAVLFSPMALTTGAFAQAVSIDPDDIGGVVTGSRGPEAGVWVIAETMDLGNRYIEIVVTDDQGRYVLPDLPKANYKVWVRGYGLVDSKPVTVSPGKRTDLKAVAAPSPKEAAEYYPANYWFSLLNVPPENAFPGTGVNGNGIAPRMKTQADWIGHLKENCQFCHQLGSKATRELEAANSIEGWDLRVQKERDSDDAFRGDLKKAAANKTIMNNNMTAFGRPVALKYFADWTDRIGKGELPKSTPPRPTGIERNIVIRMWDWGDLFIHDSSASDKRNPTVNANGKLYGVQTHSGALVELDPNSAKVSNHKLNGFNGQWDKDMVNHTSTMDSHGRYWMSLMGPAGKEHEFCADGTKSPFAKYYPRQIKGGKMVSVYDPKTGKHEVIPTCFQSHHLNFQHKGDKLFFSGDTEVVGWVDTKVWDETKDPAKAVGWCPLVLDTNGDGKISPDRAQWNFKRESLSGGEGAAVVDGGAGPVVLDPAKDTRMIGFQYGMGISPVDGTYWAARYTPTVPSGIFRVDPGPRPPETCKTEYYEAPLVNGKPSAYNSRGADVDSKGIVWVAFGTGQVGRFDRSQCKKLNGPDALGQQCPEGWTLLDTPGPKLGNTNVGADWFYLTWVDLHDSLGLGRDTPLFPGSNNDALLAYLPQNKQMVNFRVPYPMGFYARGIDGRIDDPKAGWKGKGLWANYSMQPQWHLEGGEGENLKMVKFQLRPDPLAH